MKRGIVLVGTILLAACGKPDASGLYTVSDVSSVMLVQLAQDDQGKLTGRLATSTLDEHGVVKATDGQLEGSISGDQLMLRPTSMWLGGLNASGTLNGDHLTLVGKNYTLNLTRSTLAEYQAEVGKLTAIVDDPE